MVRVLALHSWKTAAKSVNMETSDIHKNPLAVKHDHNARALLVVRKELRYKCWNQAKGL